MRLVYVGDILSNCCIKLAEREPVEYYFTDLVRSIWSIQLDIREPVK